MATSVTSTELNSSFTQAAARNKLLQQNILNEDDYIQVPLSVNQSLFESYCMQNRNPEMTNQLELFKRNIKEYSFLTIDGDTSMVQSVAMLNWIICQLVSNYVDDNVKQLVLTRFNTEFSVHPNNPKGLEQATIVLIYHLLEPKELVNKFHQQQLTIIAKAFIEETKSNLSIEQLTSWLQQNLTAEFCFLQKTSKKPAVNRSEYLSPSHSIRLRELTQFVFSLSTQTILLEQFQRQNPQKLKWREGMAIQFTDPKKSCADGQEMTEARHFSTPKSNGSFLLLPFVKDELLGEHKTTDPICGCFYWEVVCLNNLIYLQRNSEKLDFFGSQFISEIAWSSLAPKAQLDIANQMICSTEAPKQAEQTYCQLVENQDIAEEVKKAIKVTLIQKLCWWQKQSELNTEINGMLTASDCSQPFFEAALLSELEPQVCARLISTSMARGSTYSNHPALQNVAIIEQLDDDILRKLLTEKAQQNLIIASIEARNSILLNKLLSITDAQFTTKDNNTPLHLAVMKGDRECVTLLLKFGVSLRKSNNEGFMPLHLAIIHGHEDIAKMLIEHNKASVSYISVDGKARLPMHLAVIYGRTKTLTYLLQSGAIKNTNAVTKSGEDMVHLAITHHKLKALSVLIEHDVSLEKYADVPAPQRSYDLPRTPIQRAVENGNDECFELLWHGGAIRHFDNNSLFELVKGGVIKKSSGIDGKGEYIINTLIDSQFMTEPQVLAIALKAKNSQVVQIILKRVADKAKLATTLFENTSIMSIALKNGNWNCVKAFMNATSGGVHTVYYDDELKCETTPLIIAINNRWSHLVKELIRLGANKSDSIVYRGNADWLSTGTTYTAEAMVKKFNNPRMSKAIEGLE
ncbi:hypothetical protein D5018_08725 [Parashewanella curva]|uniref:Uncharacterized protein n=1 Tax=Parashewanella curva TaxID=2338552 RepID=A0A3L8Q124_9GAMM|nr:ankyrin repeat domain-containing protein [Parashewanella curva]RLV60092.1 hypothetical protein D5018_08725 [Parashewanella curva]